MLQVELWGIIIITFPLRRTKKTIFFSLMYNQWKEYFFYLSSVHSPIFLWRKSFHKGQVSLNFDQYSTCGCDCLDEEPEEPEQHVRGESGLVGPLHDDHHGRESIPVFIGTVWDKGKHFMLTLPLHVHIGTVCEKGKHFMFTLVQGEKKESTPCIH